MRTERPIKPLLNQPSESIDHLKAEIKRVNAILRQTHNPREYRQNKKHLERLERKLRLLTRKEK